MCLKILQMLLISLCVCVWAFDDIFVNGQVSQEMVNQGRTQYQLLRERGHLPRFGSCWKSAVEHVEDGCRNLSEDTQSDIALHLMNCFLEMSGHEPYNCELNKKQNLRGICISSMSDRAFNVYTEFYTHTQNICWFLRGQIWHETISENTFKVGKQLESSSKAQEELLESQKQSLEIQKSILQEGKMLEAVLDELYTSTKNHQEILRILTESVGSFQNWVVGEMSWFDSILFYTISLVFVFIVTSLKHTVGARLPLLILILFNLTTERAIYFVFISDTLLDVSNLSIEIYKYVWTSRKIFIFLQLCYLIYHFIYYKDIHVENNRLLRTVRDQNCQILKVLRNFNENNNSEVHLIDETASLSNGHYLRGRPNVRYNLRSSKQNTPELN